MPQTASPTSPTADTRWIARYGIPGGFLLLAVIALVAGLQVVALVLAGVAVAAFVADRMIRLGATSQVDRDRERSARETLREEGHWPGEPEPRAPDAPPEVTRPTPHQD